MEIELKNKLIHLSQKYFSLKFYLFGSSITDPHYRDVDILILYRNRNDLLVLKTEINFFSNSYPLDITYLTYEEEKEFDFINQVSAFELK
ncbi:hypothetical protein AsAng_0038180 [Aureispira anguillae]|uniref:Uncharacterized protein n=1 Tax=Aureispira anguillae TaxID=2864201 RepID=A0A916DV26_9BACT|nr:hypothetical protein AsAng_0038180 [Aureispira anguillae]